MSSLDRFRDAQRAPRDGFASALRELEAGRKTGRWIWHVARALGAADPRPRFAAMADHADAILAAIAADGYGRCAYTAECLRQQRT